MSSVNKVILIGNAGRDADVRYLPSGGAVANVSIATTSRRKDENGQVIEDTQWHRLTFYERLAEIAGEFITTGKQIYVEGRLKYGKYTDKDGVEKNTCDIIVTQLQLLGGRDAGDSGQQQGNQGGQRQGGYGGGQQRQAPQGGQQRQAAPQQRQRQAPRQAPAQRQAPANDFSDMDDDIPF